MFNIILFLSITLISTLYGSVVNFSPRRELSQAEVQNIEEKGYFQVPIAQEARSSSSMVVFDPENAKNDEILENIKFMNLAIRSIKDSLSSDEEPLNEESRHHLNFSSLERIYQTTKGIIDFANRQKVAGRHYGFQKCEFDNIYMDIITIEKTIHALKKISEYSFLSALANDLYTPLFDWYKNTFFISSALKKYMTVRYSKTDRWGSYEPIFDADSFLKDLSFYKIAIFLNKNKKNYSVKVCNLIERAQTDIRTLANTGTKITNYIERAEGMNKEWLLIFQENIPEIYERFIKNDVESVKKGIPEEIKTLSWEDQMAAIWGDEADSLMEKPKTKLKAKKIDQEKNYAHPKTVIERKTTKSLTLAEKEKIARELEQQKIKEDLEYQRQQERKAEKVKTSVRQEERQQSLMEKKLAKEITLSEAREALTERASKNWVESFIDVFKKRTELLPEAFKSFDINRLSGNPKWENVKKILEELSCTVHDGIHDNEKIAVYFPGGKIIWFDRPHHEQHEMGQSAGWLIQIRKAIRSILLP